MKHARVTLLVLALLPSGIAAACASGESPIFDEGTGGRSTTSGTGTGGPVCVEKCTTDQECQDSCPSVDPGVNCCDTTMGICYANASTCPMTKPDGGTGTGGGGGTGGMPPY